MRRLGVLSGGGDCPGTNAVIASIVKVAARLDYEIIGFEYGLEGLLSPVNCRTLTIEDAKGISHLGGTILKTTNKGRFSSKAGQSGSKNIDPKVLEEAKANLDKLEVEGLIVIGGDGTLSAAIQLAELGVRIIGVPKTIDNDLGYTDVTFGFSSAVDVVVDALDKIHTTATSHERTFIVECMGRNTGWIGLSAGLSGGANAILLPEFDFSIDDLIEFMRRRRDDNHRSTVIAIAEGTRVNDRLSYEESRTSGDEIRYTGAAESLQDAILDKTQDEFDLRHVVLGHTQRGGAPNPTDRILSKRYGIAAIEVYDQGRQGEMVCLVNGSMRTCPIEEAANQVKQVTQEVDEYYAARRLGIFIH